MRLWISLASVTTALFMSAAALGATGDFTVFKLTSGHRPSHITTGSDGNLWFTEFTRDQIGRISPDGTARKVFRLPAGSNPSGISRPPLGRAGDLVWWSEFSFSNSALAFSPLTPQRFATMPFPFQVTPGPDGNVWFSLFNGGVGRFNVADSTISYFGVPPSCNERPCATEIAAGADGNLWVAEEIPQKIARITPSGVVSEFDVPGWPAHLAPGPDGNIWFTEFAPNGRGAPDVGWITPNGTVTLVSLPADQGLGGIVAAPDGNIWFVVSRLDGHVGIARRTPDGTLTQFFPTGVNEMDNLAVGPDGNLWFPDATGPRVGRVEVADPGTGYVLATDASFAPTSRTVPQGTPVRWTFVGPSEQEVADSSGMGLFDSGVKQIVSYYTAKFDVAATYSYADALHPGAQLSGSIVVPLQSPLTGRTGVPFTVTWAAQSPTSPYVVDVQVKTPGSPWASWQSGVTTTSASYTPATPGAYRFRSRLRNNANGKASLWSPTRSVTVS